MSGRTCFWISGGTLYDSRNTVLFAEITRAAKHWAASNMRTHSRGDLQRGSSGARTFREALHQAELKLKTPDRRCPRTRSRGPTVDIRRAVSVPLARPRPDLQDPGNFFFFFFSNRIGPQNGSAKQKDRQEPVRWDSRDFPSAGKRRWHTTIYQSASRQLAAGLHWGRQRIETGKNLQLGPRDGAGSIGTMFVRQCAGSAKGTAWVSWVAKRERLSHPGQAPMSAFDRHTLSSATIRAPFNLLCHPTPRQGPWRAAAEWREDFQGAVLGAAMRHVIKERPVNSQAAFSRHR